MNLSVSNVGSSNISPAFTSKNKQKVRQEQLIFVNEDALENKYASSKKDKAHNNKFDFSEAMKNLGKGLISPITAIIEHPVATIGIIAGAAVATTLVPVLGPVMAVGFGALSIGQMAKGTYDAVKNYKNGNYDASEKSFDKIGQGIVGTLMSGLGIKQGAKIAREAKLMNELGVKSLNQAQRSEIAAKVDAGDFLSAVEDNLSLFKNKAGFKAILNQFKPSSIKTRYTEAIEALKGKRTIIEEKEIKKEKRVSKNSEDFTKTPEGIRRANLTNEQVEQEVTAIYNEAFDRLNIPKELRPKINLKEMAKEHCGSYGSNGHEILINPNAYKAGTMELESTIMHEATHCKEALLRAGIPQDRANKIVMDELISRINNGEAEKIVVSGGGFIGPEMMEPPKMSANMKKDFIEFAKNELYQDKINGDFSNYSTYFKSQMDRKRIKGITDCSKELAELKPKVQPLLDKLEVMLNNNPEFIAQFGNREEALNALMRYSVSHNIRYNSFRNVSINTQQSFLFSHPDSLLKVPELKGEQLVKAEQSLINNITTMEGNGRIAGLNGIFSSQGSFNQYQFSPEEVLAETNGKKFLIEKLSAKIAEMKSGGRLNPQEEARLSKLMETAKTVIEYRTKGLEYYNQYTKMINNPNDKVLANTVNLLEKELQILKNKITAKDYEIITEVIKVINKQYDVATTMIPANAIYGLLGKSGNNNQRVA